MLAASVAALYLLVGLVAAWALAARGASALAMLLLWPFLLPPRLASGPAALVPGEAGAALARARAALAALPAPPDAGARVLAELEGALARRATRRGELQSALTTAPHGVQERLRELLELEARELEAGRVAAEELAAQLTLLRFAGRSAAGDEALKEAVDTLLARIEAEISLAE